MPHQYRSYIADNLLATGEIKRYNNKVPQAGRPKQFIDHCIARLKSAELEYGGGGESILSSDTSNMTFKVKSATDGNIVYTCNLTAPMCQCPDWSKNKLPCKHMFLIFQHIPKTGCNSLPSSYLDLPFLTIDKDILQSISSVPKSTCPPEIDDVSELSDDETINDDYPDLALEDASSVTYLKKSSSKSVKSLHRKCISQLETLENKVYECKDRSVLTDAMKQLESLIENVDSSLMKEEGIAVSITDKQIEKKTFPSEPRASDTSDDEDFENVKPLKHPRSNVKYREHWKSRGRSGKKAKNFRDARNCPLPSNDHNTKIETSVITGEVSDVSEFTELPDEVPNAEVTFTEEEQSANYGRSPLSDITNQAAHKSTNSNVRSNKPVEKPIPASFSNNVNNRKSSTGKPNLSGERSCSEAFHNPDWGREVKVKNTGEVILLRNTCPVDNWLVFIKVISLDYIELFGTIVNKYRGADNMLIHIFELVKANRFTEAKWLFALKNGLKVKRGILDLYGNEDDYVTRHLLFLLAHNLTSTCSNPQCPDSDLSETFNHYPHLPGGKHITKIEFNRFRNEWLFKGWTSNCGRKFSTLPEDITNVYLDDVLDVEQQTRYLITKLVIILSFNIESIKAMTFNFTHRHKK